MPAPLFRSFVAGAEGPWAIDCVDAVAGESLAGAQCLRVVEERRAAPEACAWSIAGTTSNLRYTTAAEAETLAAVQEGLGRPLARQAAMIPIRKSEAWWALPQDERRSIIQEQSRHISIGLDYLPAVARRLYHCRDLGEAFDFVTWFEFAPEHAGAFEAMVGRLRDTKEWTYVEREVDLRMTRRSAGASDV